MISDFISDLAMRRPTEILCIRDRQAHERSRMPRLLASCASSRSRRAGPETLEGGEGRYPHEERFTGHTATLSRLDSLSWTERSLTLSSLAATQLPLRLQPGRPTITTLLPASCLARLDNNRQRRALPHNHCSTGRAYEKFTKTANKRRWKSGIILNTAKADDPAI